MTTMLLLTAASWLHRPCNAIVDNLNGYSTNAICKQKFCINPVFPGYLDIYNLETVAWQCYSRTDVKRYINFCAAAVWYDVAIPSPNTTMTLEDLVYSQDKAAATMYFYHLNGMNIEPWKHRDPANSPDDCLRSVWQMVCNTYFPRVEAGCQPGEVTRYLRPCRSVCENYLNSCGVSCCDESTKCVFQNKVLLKSGKTIIRSGYIDEVGPAATCTGGSNSAGVHTMGSPIPLLVGLVMLMQMSLPTTLNVKSSAMVALLSATMISLQGCEATGHAAANWESKASYIVDFQFVPPGQPVSTSVLNSCQITNLPLKLRCNGNGACKQFQVSASKSPMFFCQCDRDWADPECRTRRKSQAKAFFLSLLFGYLGIDRFYLGMYFSGIAKMVTVGGAGVWWLIDLVRIGSSPIYATDYRLAQDFSHALYVFITVVFFTLMGALIFWVWGLQMKKSKRKKRKMQHAEEDFFKMRSATVDLNPSDAVNIPLSYPARLPSGIDVHHQANRHMAQPWAWNYGAVQQERSIAEQETRPLNSYRAPNPSHPPQLSSLAVAVEGPRPSFPINTSRVHDNSQAQIQPALMSAAAMQSPISPVSSAHFPTAQIGTPSGSEASLQTIPPLLAPDESKPLTAAPSLAEQPS